MTSRDMQTIIPSGIELVLSGVEGQLLRTEPIHYGKWYQFALNAEIILENGHPTSFQKAFQHLWQTNLTGVGDRAIYDLLKNRPRFNGKKKEFPTWESCESRINEFYRKNIQSGRIVNDAAEAMDWLCRDGVRTFFVTHAPRPLVEDQLDFFEKETGWHVDLDRDVMLGERKDGDAYLKAMERINDERRAKDMSDLKPAQVLVIDDGEKYLARAKALGMNIARIENNLQGYLKPRKIDESIPTLGWSEICRDIAEGRKTNAVPEVALFMPVI